MLYIIRAFSCLLALAAGLAPPAVIPQVRPPVQPILPSEIAVSELPRIGTVALVATKSGPDHAARLRGRISTPSAVGSVGAEEEAEVPRRPRANIDGSKSMHAVLAPALDAWRMSRAPLLLALVAAALALRHFRGVAASADGREPATELATLDVASDLQQKFALATFAGQTAADGMRAGREAATGEASLVTAAAGTEGVGTAVAEAEVETRAAPDPAAARPLQVIKIDLETNSVVVGENEILILDSALRQTGVEKVAVVGVMGPFRSGKSFLLDLMLRYLNFEKGRLSPNDDEECEVLAWAMERDIPAWVARCGNSLVEGRQGSSSMAAQTDVNGFLWRPGMEKCTEGVWIWSEPFVCRAGGEDVALLLMDTQGAWDAKMTVEQSAMVFGLTTLTASRLVYNVSKQIQQDKIDNLLYFTEFAQAALRITRGSSLAEGTVRPFQTLDFLVRDWPHYAEGSSVQDGRQMMTAHLAQYADPNISEDTKSMDTLDRMFQKLDVWALPHPSLAIEREKWDGDLKIIEPEFWRFLDAYFRKIFSSDELSAKTVLGTAVTVDTFSTVLREFIKTFENAGLEARTFSQAMETSSCLLARDSAMKLLKSTMDKESSRLPDALDPEEFERIAAETTEKVEDDFKSKAIYGSEEGIEEARDLLRKDVAEELVRYREENLRKVDAALNGLTDVSAIAVGAFAVDKISDVACDWWSELCREVSGDLSFGYTAVFLLVGFKLYNINSERGQLDASVAAMELSKSVAKKGNEWFREAGDKGREILEDISNSAKK